VKTECNVYFENRRPHGSRMALWYMVSFLQPQPAYHARTQIFWQRPARGSRIAQRIFQRRSGAVAQRMVAAPAAEATQRGPSAGRRSASSAPSRVRCSSACAQPAAARQPVQQRRFSPQGGAQFAQRQASQQVVRRQPQTLRRRIAAAGSTARRRRRVVSSHAYAQAEDFTAFPYGAQAV